MENLILRRKKRYRHIHIANPSSPPVRTSDHRNLIMKNPTQTHLQSKKTKNVGTLGDGNTPNFPPEIIEEILKRLPVESLLKFRCVSKLWRSLISSPEFIKIHLNFSTSNPSFTNHRIISNILDTDLDPKLSLVNPLLPEHETEIDYPMKGLDRIVWVVGSCNGLVCLALDDSNICLWNPTMRTSKKLPPLSVVMKKSFHYLWSFGFDECDDDYKVVGIRSSGRLNSKVMIYSLKADSWKRIKNFKSGIPSKDSGKYASGKLHFAAKDRDSGWNIVSLDLSSEVYGMVEQPNYGSGSNDSTLGVLGGCVCVLRNYPDIRGDVWVLKEYNVKESWTKLISIPYNGRVKYLLTTPLVVLPNGEVLLDYERHFEVYNPKDNSFRISEATNVNGFITADIYVESLVSL